MHRIANKISAVHSCVNADCLLLLYGRWRIVQCLQYSKGVDCVPRALNFQAQGPKNTLSLFTDLEIRFHGISYSLRRIISSPLPAFVAVRRT